MNANNNNNNNIIRLKAIRSVFLGDEEVGKSSLINAYLGIEFNDMIYQTFNSEKFDKKINVEGRDYKLIVFDTPGRERFRRYIRPYVIAAKIVVLVFDMTRKKTFLELDNILEFLEDNISNFKKCNFVLIGNKADLVDRWEIKEKDAQKFAEIIHAKFFLASAKTNQTEFTEFMDGVVEDYILKNKDEIEQQAANNQQRAINLNNNRNRRRSNCH